MVVAWIWRRCWHTQTPRDYLFLGAVAGLVFGAAEVVRSFADVLGSISGDATGLGLQTLIIRYRLAVPHEPIDRACWAGIAGYFVGRLTGQDRKCSIGLVGCGIAAVLHGLNDWNPINSRPAWVLVTLISVLLFLGYARAGAWLPQQAMASPAGRRCPRRRRMPPAQAPRAPRPAPPSPPAPTEWWQHVPAASAPSAPPAPSAPRPAPATRPAPLRTPPPPRRTIRPPRLPRSSASRPFGRGGNKSDRSVTG